MPPSRSFGGVNPKELIDGVANDEAAVTKVALKSNSLFQMKPDEFSASLGQALVANTNVTELHLQDCGVTDAGAASLAAALESNASVTALSLEGNRVGADGAMAIARALTANTTLRTLNLMNQKAGSKFGDACLDEFIKALDTNVFLLKITWRLDSRKSFSLTKLLNRNNEINRRLKAGRDATDILPQSIRANPPPLAAFVPPEEDANATDDAQSSSPVGKMLRSVRRASAKGVEALGEALAGVAQAGRRISGTAGIAASPSPSPTKPSAVVVPAAFELTGRAKEIADAQNKLRRAAALLSEETREKMIVDIKAIVAALEAMGAEPEEAPATAPAAAVADVEKEPEPLESHQPITAVSPSTTDVSDPSPFRQKDEPTPVVNEEPAPADAAAEEQPTAMPADPPDEPVEPDGDAATLS